MLRLSAASTWLPWPALEPIPGSALDLKNLNERPAGAHAFIEVRDGHFATSEGQRLRFWGCNLSSGENFPRRSHRHPTGTGGKIPLTALLRCRIRHFTDGAVLGSQAFMQHQLATYRTLHQRRARTAARPMPALTDGGGLATLSGLHKPALD